MRSLLLWLPAALVAASLLVPVVYLVIRAASGSQGLWETVFRPQNAAVLGNSLALAIGVAFCSALLATPLAWLTVRTDLPLRRFWAVLTALPLVIPSYIGAYLMVSTIGPRGLLQGWLEPLGVERLPSIYGFPGALTVLTLLSYPYTLLSVRASLLGMDPALEEASRSLGRTAWDTFWKVTFPQMRPGLAAGSLLVALYALRDFGAVAIMRYDSFTRVIYIQYQSLIDRSAAAGLALVLVAVTIGMIWIEQRTQQAHRLYSSGSFKRPPAILPLGRWKLPAVLFCGFVVLVSLVIPAANLGFWLVRGFAAGEQLGRHWGATFNSLAVSAAAAVVIVAAALPVSVLSVRRPGRLAGLLDRVSYIGFALPGVVIALALVFFGANYAPWLYQTIPMLIFAYLVLFLPQATGAVQTSLKQVHPNLEEAGRSLGRSPLTVFRRVILPIVRPGLLSGAALVFLTAMKELPATLILSPIGFGTLATSVWGAVNAVFFARAAVPALLLIVVSSVPMGILILRRDL
ncbi:MAG TPA: iron ABC transporter permease [Anaerolineales bacterium]|nr:iron ABC transporter permease [Anaerolineales bacterium]